jgi:hypothetical protein
MFDVVFVSLVKGRVEQLSQGTWTVPGTPAPTTRKIQAKPFSP